MYCILLHTRNGDNIFTQKWVTYRDTDVSKNVIRNKPTDRKTMIDDHHQSR